MHFEIDGKSSPVVFSELKFRMFAISNEFVQENDIKLLKNYDFPSPSTCFEHEWKDLKNYEDKWRNYESNWRNYGDWTFDYKR